MHEFCSTIAKTQIPMLKKIFILLPALLFCVVVSGQTVYSTEWKSEAKVKVYVTEYKSEADLIVYKTEWKSEAKDNNGIWFFTKWKSEAKKTIYFTDWKSEADLIIYFTEYKSEAGWKKKSKKHLMY